MDIEEIKRRANIVEVIGSYVALKKRGSEYVARCPFHSPDNHPSFYVVPTKNIYHCFSCDASGDVINFLQEHEGLDFKSACERLNGGTTWPTRAITQEAKPLPERLTRKPPAGAAAPKMALRDLGEPVKVWTYRDALGDVLGYVARYEREWKKEFRCWTFGARGDLPPSWGVGAWSKPRPLYGLDRLNNRAVLVVEGEKAAEAADALLGARYAALTWPGGAQAWRHSDWEPLRARHVLLWPDADEPGVKAMQGLASLLADPNGLGCAVRIVEPPPDQAEGADIADALTAGMSTAEVIAYGRAHVKPYVHIAEQQENPECRDSDTVESENPAPPLPAPSGESTTSLGLAAGAGPDNFEDSAQNAQDGSGAMLRADGLDPIPATENRAAALKPGKARPRNALKPPHKPHLAAVDGNAARQPDPEAEAVPVALSEDHLAAEFVDIHGKDWRYVARWGRWFRWGGDVWREDEVSEVFQRCREICRSAAHWPEAAPLSPDGKRKLGRKATAGNVRDMAGADPRCAARAEQWDTDAFLLGVPGGVVDLKTGEMMDGAPEQYITKRCAVAPVQGEHPLFDMVLARACADDPGMRAYLLRWFGYVLTGDVREECFVFLHGPGGSGKGTLVKCIGDILGDYARTISMEALIESKMQRHPQELAKLDRARLVYASETEEGRRWNESLIKWLTGRDKVTAHFMRENDFEFYPQFKLLIYGNHIPHLKSVGEEMRRRVHLIEYAGSLADDERDTTLKDRLVAEYPAILHTLMRSCVEWQDTGLGKPERVSLATSQYLEAEDTLGLWMEDNVERTPQGRVLSGDVYADFKRWAEAGGEFVMSAKRFTQTMKQRGFDATRSGGKRYLIGLELRQKPDAQAAADAYYNRK